MADTSNRKTGIYVTAGLLLVLAVAGAVALAQLGTEPGLDVLERVREAGVATGVAGVTRELQGGGMLPWLLVPVAGPILVMLILLVSTRGGARTSASASAEGTPEVAEDPADAPADAPGAGGLRLLAAFQEEARLVDFVREDLDGYSDEQVGAAVRGIHAALRRAVEDRLTLESILAGDDGDVVEVPADFSPGLIRVTGNPSGEPPYRGVLRHGGWRATEVRLPVATPGSDPTILAPAEVEVGAA
ncbi:MAG: DUF2760 domain-containing protein [Deltaproteobacteria bacterium]|nr:DUF2760 domain-containing protein [Deltaproteobacteria bacterium]